jgi:hypothetical protein
MPGSIVGYAVSFRPCKVNFAGISIRPTRRDRGIPSE